MGVIRTNKSSDAYEWQVMNKVFSKDEIIDLVFKDDLSNKTHITREDKKLIYELCNDYYVGNTSKSELQKKYPSYSKSFINSIIHKVIMWWQNGLSEKTFKYSALKVQDAYFKENAHPKVYFGSKADYFAQRGKYILSMDFIKPHKTGSDRMIYAYYIYGQSLDKLLNSPDDIIAFYHACKDNGFISNITIKDFVSTTDFGEEAEKFIRSTELEKIQVVQEKIDNLEKQISLLKDELNSYKAEKRLLYKSMDMEEDGLYVQTSFEV